MPDDWPRGRGGDARGRGAGPTTLDRSRIALAASAGQTIDVALDGLRFTPGKGVGTPVSADGSADGVIQLTVDNCRFTKTKGGFSGGIVAMHHGVGTVSLVVTNRTFTKNRDVNVGGVQRRPMARARPAAAARA